MESQGKLITIGIPTYNRPQPLKDVFLGLNSLYEKHPIFNVLVVDDSSDDQCKNFNIDAVKRLEKTGLFPIEYYQNLKNVGFAYSFIEILKKCKTEYLLLLADDDEIIPDYFEKAVVFTIEKELALLSPQWVYRNSNKLGRGVKETRPIKPKEFRLCSDHAPGLIINTEVFRKEVPRVELHLNKRCAATTTYPLAVFTAGVLVNYPECYWYNKPIVREGHSMPSGIKDSAGNHYSSLHSRIQQIAAFDNLLLSLPQSKMRDEMLFESRAWSIAKALWSSKKLRKEIIDRLAPSLVFKVKRRLLNYLK